VDGDVVPAVPPFKKYVHVGTEILIDGLGQSGSIIINPSYVEKKLMQKTKSSVMGHLLGAYKNGLDNIKDVSEGTVGLEGITLEPAAAASYIGGNNNNNDRYVSENNISNDVSNISTDNNQPTTNEPKLAKMTSLRKAQQSTMDVAQSAFKLQRNFQYGKSFYGNTPVDHLPVINEDNE
jgi:hypothetical protein